MSRLCARHAKSRPPDAMPAIKRLRIDKGKHRHRNPCASHAEDLSAHRVAKGFFRRETLKGARTIAR